MKNNSEIRKEWFIQQIKRLNNEGVTTAEIARQLGVLPQYISNIVNGDRGASEKFTEKLCIQFNINQNDLLNRQKKYHAEPVKKVVASEPIVAHAIELNQDGIPLIPIEAVAGFALKGDAVAMEYDIAERYLVPEFSVRGVKYLIRVSGSSMYPKYSNGDILACRPVTDLSFFQWGKVYVLDTDQGALVKRLFEGKDDVFIECRSDNKEHYPAFQIPKTSIRSISIVVGVIRLD